MQWEISSLNPSNDHRKKGKFSNSYEKLDIDIQVKMKILLQIKQVLKWFEYASIFFCF